MTNQVTYTSLLNDDKFLDFYDEDLTIFFPIRNSHTRARSELLETSKNYSGEDLISHIKNTISNGFTLNPRLSYFKNDIMLFFLKNILPNEKWKGCKIKFFDIKIIQICIFIILILNKL